MFSALKRLTTKGDQTNNGSVVAPPGMQTMSSNLQRKFARGVQYNMKIIIKGDRNVGKSSLFRRLQGQKFTEDYTQTEEIQVACIQWNYKATDDVVKVEVWDIVDKGKKKKRFEGLKLDNSAGELPEEPALDAEFLDVYKGTNGVIMMLDITKQWTFEYIKREIMKVPTHIPVLVLANHRDMGHHRTVSTDDVTFFIESLERPSDAATVMYTESSMRNGFGLKFLHKFFNLPFLQLQRETLLKQLETNGRETQSTLEELEVYSEGDDSNYDAFLDNLTNRRRVQADAMSPSSNGFVPVASAPPPQIPSSKSAQQIIAASTGAGNVRRSLTSGNISSNMSSDTQPSPMKQTEVITKSPVTSSPVPPAEGSKPPEPQQKSGFLTNFFGRNKDTSSPQKQSAESSNIIKSANSTDEHLASVDDFVADGGEIDRSFLEDHTTSPVHTANAQAIAESDSDDEDIGNPLVASFQDDLDPDDTAPGVATFGFNSGAVVNAISSDEEETNTKGPTIIEVSAKIETPPQSKSSITADALESFFGKKHPAALQKPIGLRLQTSDTAGEDDDVTYVYPLSTDGCEGSHLNVDGSELSLRSNSPALETETRLLTQDGDAEESRGKKKRDGKVQKKHKKKTKEKVRSEEKSEPMEKKWHRNSKSSSRKSSRQERDELEEFLNGPTSMPNEAAYEAI